ncbi:hypothetical protein N9V00_01785 [Bacteroidota bacterium]|nr:hypothetical protein [Bacteroidota bacterium]
MIKKYLSVFVLIPFFLFSQEKDTNGDECKLLLKNIEENAVKLSMDDLRINVKGPMSETWWGFHYGIYLKKDYSNPVLYNEIPFYRDSEGFVIIDKISPDLIFHHEIDEWDYDSHGYKVISFNGMKTNELEDSDINELFFNAVAGDYKLETVLSKSEDEEKKVSFDLWEYEITAIPISLTINSLNFIDSSNSTFNVRYGLDTVFTPNGLVEVARNTFLEAIENDDKLLGSYGFYCKFPTSTLSDIGIYFPNLELDNLIRNYDISDSLLFDYEFIGTLDDIEFEKANFELKRDATGIFKSPFRYQSFPFDKQTLVINVVASDLSYQAPFYASNSSFENSVQELFLNEWNVSARGVSAYISTLDPAQDRLGEQFKIEIERNFSYYLIKIFLPILFILMMSMSVFFISPSQIESRLTVSVVCFLALITYTYIADSDLPKLGYMSVMDYMILTSYLFASIPTFQTIYVYYLCSTNSGQAIKVDNLFRRYGPLLYSLILVLLIIGITSGNPNTVQALRLFE